MASEAKRATVRGAADLQLDHAVLRVSNGESRFLPGLVQEELGCRVAAMDPAKAVVLPAGSDPADPRWQSLAPALGAALGRRA